MSTQTEHFLLFIGLMLALGSAMPNRTGYIFPRQFGLYLFDWFYATIKIITLNLAKEVEKKGIKFEELPPNTTVVTPPAPPSPPVA